MIPYGRHSVNDSDIESVISALKSDWLTTGPKVEEFEQALQSVVGAPTISVSSGTAALHCAYAAIGIEPGDEIITPPITFIATQATAALLGAKIVFADVLTETGNINPKTVEAAITNRTKAIVAVDYAGHPADLDELREIADKHSIYLIEDASHSLGSMYNGRPIGSIADLTTFSFFPTKNLTTGEGGAVSSTKPHLLEKVRKFSRQGLIRESENFIYTTEGPWHQEVHQFGLNYRLPDLLCAFGISQLTRLPEFKKRRKAIYDIYTAELKNSSKVKTPIEKEYVDANWHLFPIQVPKTERLKIYTKLREKGILVQVNYFPVHLHPVFESLGFKRGDYPVSEEFYDSEISLPMHFELSNKDLEFICTTLMDI
jgi:UDP-4-amino-4,6-dideoxy-N-acetyl-beta-L-altrosamine transaminase